MVEFFGAHEFALLKPDALKPLSTLDKCPNKSVRDRGVAPDRLRLLLALPLKNVLKNIPPFVSFPAGIISSFVRGCRHFQLYVQQLCMYYTSKYDVLYLSLIHI